MKSNTGHGDGCAYKALESPWLFFLLTLAAVAFHFSRVGDDEGAMEMLTHLDNCDEVGAYVDCLPGVYFPGNTVLLVYAPLINET